jgi:hypothetical protein
VTVVGLAATVSAFAVAGLGLLSPSTSQSAALRVGFTATPTVGGHHNQRLAVTERGLRFSFEVPPSWERKRVATGEYPNRGPMISVNKSGIGPQDAEAIIYWTSFPNGVHADRCADVLSAQIGPSAAALANAVARAPGIRRVSGPSHVTLGGRPATYLELRVREAVGCDPGFFYSWREGPGGAFWREIHMGDTIRVWIVPVRGKRLFIAGVTRAYGGRHLAGEVRQIVGSIRFG